MQVEVYPDAAAAAARAASLIADSLAAAVADRGAGSAALSGGRTPTLMMQALALAALPWPQIHLFQVDERMVGASDSRRNLTAMNRAFRQCPLPPANLHAMPVEARSSAAGAARYSADLRRLAGTPPRLDVVHLGLGEDGHTASLVPGDAAVTSQGDVTLSGDYQGVRRMTLTLPLLNAARQRVWLVTGSAKREIVRRFLDGDSSLVASQVSRQDAYLVLDTTASGERE